LKKLWPDIVTIPSNYTQISVALEVIEKLLLKQISPEDFETWRRGMDKEKNIFYEMSDEDI